MKKKKTKHEKDYHNWLAENGRCAICNAEKVELHHIRSNRLTPYKSHKRMLPLCLSHHRGNYSVHAKPEKFNKDLPMEQQLMMADNYYRRFEKESGR